MTTIKIPRTLQTGSGALQFTGVGRTPKTFSFFDPNTGRSLDLYLASVIRSGAAFGSSALVENETVPPLTIPQQAPVGSSFLVELKFDRAGISVVRWWIVPRPPQDSVTKPPVANQPYRGRIVDVDQQLRFVFVEAADGVRMFAHSTALNNVAMRIGQKVSFRIGKNSKGPVAIDVRPAA